MSWQFKTFDADHAIDDSDNMSTIYFDAPRCDLAIAAGAASPGFIAFVVPKVDVGVWDPDRIGR